MILLAGLKCFPVLFELIESGSNCQGGKRLRMSLGVTARILEDLGNFAEAIRESVNLYPSKAAHGDVRLQALRYALKYLLFDEDFAPRSDPAVRNSYVRVLRFAGLSLGALYLCVDPTL